MWVLHSTGSRICRLDVPHRPMKHQQPDMNNERMDGADPHSYMDVHDDMQMRMSPIIQLMSHNGRALVLGHTRSTVLEKTENSMMGR